MRGETQKNPHFETKRGTTILNIFLTKSQELFFKKCDKHINYGMISVEIEERNYANTVKAT